MENTRKATGQVTEPGNLKSCISNPKSKIVNWTVRSEICDFEFKIQDLSDFKISLSGLPVLVHLRRPMVMLAPALRGQLFGSGIFLPGLFRGFYSDLLGIVFRAFGAPHRYTF